jgi:hypothetical protein
MITQLIGSITVAPITLLCALLLICVDGLIQPRDAFDLSSLRIEFEDMVAYAEFFAP